MIAALYARYSSDSQRAESIVAQIRAGREYCRRKGYHIIKEYADEAYTGTNDNRPAYREMLRDAAAGLFEVVIFHKVDRNGRNEFDYYKNKQELARHNVRVEYSGQAFDSTSPEGALMENQLVGLAAYYSRNLSREVKKGLKENVLAGKITGGRPLFGYSVDKNKKYVINEEEAVAVRYIFERYAAGASYIDILREVNARGYRTRRGAEFGKATLHDMLNNRRYIGTCILGKNQPYLDGRRNSHRPDHDGMIIVPNGCPAIISPDLFQAVHERMQENRRRGGRRTAKYPYLLSGLVYCGECGASMSGTRTRTRKKEIREYYRCCQKSNHGDAKCPNRYIYAPALENFIIERLAAVIDNENLLFRLAQKVQEKYDALVGNARVQIAALQEQEAKASKSLERLYEVIADGDTFDDFDRAQMKHLKQKILDIRAQREKLEQQPGKTISSAEIVHYIRDRFLPAIRQRTASGLTELLQYFVHTVTVFRDKIRVEYWFAACRYSSERTSKTRISIVREYPRELIVA